MSRIFVWVDLLFAWRSDGPHAGGLDNLASDGVAAPGPDGASNRPMTKDGNRERDA